MCALPHQFKHKIKIKTKKPRADRSDSSSSEYEQKIKLRRLSKSVSSVYSNNVKQWNIKNEFGKGIWDKENYQSDKGLVGPLKIVKLPPGPPAKSIVGTPLDSHRYSMMMSKKGSMISKRGSIAVSPPKFRPSLEV